VVAVGRRDTRPRSDWLFGVLATAILATSTEPAFGAEVAHFYGYRAEFSDNVQRVPDNPQHDMLNALLVGVTYEDRSRTLDLRLAPIVEYIHYVKDSFDDELRANLDSILHWRISPERLTWTAEDSAQQVRIDPTQPDTPTNTTLANFFATGPDLYLGRGSVNRFQLGARYINIYVSDTNLDSQRGRFYGRWLHQISPQTTLSLNAETEKVEYDDDVNNANFQRRDVFFRIETNSFGSTFTADVGTSTIEFDGAAEVEEGLARLGWNRRLNSQTILGVTAESGIGDTGSDLALTAAAANDPTGATGTTSQNLVAQDVFTAKRGQIFFNRFGSRLNTDLSLFARNLEFHATPIDDRDESGGDVTFGYYLSAVMSIDVFYSRSRVEFRNRPLVDSDVAASVGFSRRVGRNVSSALRLQQDYRESTDPSREFVENRVIFSVNYNFGTMPRR
jgi:hypothetical protein